MADFSIDQNNLPGVKEVCRDFAVLEDHCLAHNLQEQEIESHLASNVYKSRLAQQDLQVAKRMQEEEDLRAKAENKRQHRRMERIDNEMAQEIQEQLVRQAEQQRKQEEKDEAIARKLQDREMKEERKRQKQQEANFEEDYYEDKASRFPPDLREVNPRSASPAYKKEKHHSYSPVLSPYNSPDQTRKRNPNSRSQYQDYQPAELVRSRLPDSPNKGRTLEHFSPERRPKHSEDYLKDRHKPLDLDSTEPLRWKKIKQEVEPGVRRKEKPPRDFSAERERAWDKERNRNHERERDGRRAKDRPKEQNRAKSEDRLLTAKARDRTQNTEYGQNGYGHSGKDGNKVRQKNGERELDYYSLDPARGCSEDGVEWEDFKRQPRLPSGPNEVFEDPTMRGVLNEGRAPGHSPKVRGRKVHGEYSMNEAIHGLDQLDIHDLEVKDMEVARRLQEEEIKASKVDKRAAQVAQDEELARRLMEEEKREYKRSKGKQAMEKRRPEIEYKPVQEEVVRPRSREEMPSREEEYQRQRNHKPARPPPPTHNYENINPGYVYAEGPYNPNPQSRPEMAYKDAYYRQ